MNPLLNARASVRDTLRPKGDTVSDIGDSFDEAADRIEAALERVEKAINDKWSTAQWVVFIIIIVYLSSLPGRMWHSKWRYTWEYDIPESDVSVQDEPHDCEFLAAPLGEKYCHYDRSVSITRWATSQADTPIISYDDGATWSAFDPAGKEVPKLSTVKAVEIGWEKKDN
jgi:hypothetical protein